MASGTALPPTSWSGGPICGPSRSSSATPACRPPRSTRTSTPGIFWRYTARRTRARKHYLLYGRIQAASMAPASKTRRLMAPSDEELVEQFQGGDSSAFDALVYRWERKVQGAIYRLVGPGEDVRDLSQETFLKAYRGLRT